MSPEVYRLLADLVLALHAGLVLFVVLGQASILAGWRRGWVWTRGLMFRGLHLSTIAVVLAQDWLGSYCPLTLLEVRLRHLAGAQGYETGFVADWLGRLLYYRAPGWVFTLSYTLFGLLVLLTWVAYPPRRKVPG